MAIYSLATQTTVVTTTVPSMDWQGASGNNPKVMELFINNGATTQCTYGYGRSANTPVQTGTTLVQAENYADPAGKTTNAVTWSTAPTVPAVFLRRAILPATIGAGMIFTFPRGLTLQGAGPSFVQWNIAASSAVLNAHIVVDE